MLPGGVPQPPCGWNRTLASLPAGSATAKPPPDLGPGIPTLSQSTRSARPPPARKIQATARCPGPAEAQSGKLMQEVMPHPCPRHRHWWWTGLSSTHKAVATSSASLHSWPRQMRGHWPHDPPPLSSPAARSQALLFSTPKHATTPSLQFFLSPWPSWPHLTSDFSKPAPCHLSQVHGGKTPC